MVFSTLLMLLFTICLAGIIYPFRPFKSRKWAAGMAVLVFLGTTVAVTVESADPELVAKRAALANTAIAEAETAIAAGNVEEAKAILQNLDYRVADQEAAAISETQAKITRIELTPKLAAISTDGTLSASNKINQIKEMWKTLGKSDAAKRLMSNDFEGYLLPVVKPLPASETLLNKRGYELLSRITQYAPTPNPNYSAKAKSYSQKAAVAANKAKGCPLPNYGFTSQVPSRLKNPSSFKPIRVYLGAKDGQGYQAAYMDYYATNGFGGKIKQTATGKVNLSTCRFSLIAP